MSRSLDVLAELRSNARATQTQRAKAEARRAAAENSSTHPDAGVPLALLVVDEQSRRPINRSVRRAHGQRSGYARRMRYRLALSADFARLDRIDDNPHCKARHLVIKAERAARKERVNARVSARRARLGIN